MYKDSALVILDLPSSSDVFDELDHDIAVQVGSYSSFCELEV